MAKHINPFEKMTKKQLKAGIAADIDSRFGNKKVSKTPKGAGNFLHLTTKKAAKAS